MKFDSKYNIEDSVFIKRNLVLSPIEKVTIQSISFFKDKVLYKFYGYSELFDENEIITLKPGTKVKVKFDMDLNKFECYGFIHGISNNKFTLYLTDNYFGKDICIENVPFLFIEEIYV